MDVERAALDLLPDRIRVAIEKSGLLGRICEIRLRSTGAVSLTVGEKNFVIDSVGRLTGTKGGLFCSQKEVSSVISAAVGSSMYRYSNAIKNGYVTTPRGIRVGFCLRGVQTQSAALSPIDSADGVNIRIPRFLRGCSSSAVDFFKASGIGSALFFAPPGGGKTTFIRDLALNLSEGGVFSPLRVCVVDSRDELFPSGFDQKGRGLLDVMRTSSKSEGIARALHIFNPQVIICDELEKSEDFEAMLKAARGACICMATLHGDSKKAFLSDPFVKKLIFEGRFLYASALKMASGSTSCSFFNLQEG